MIPHVKQGDSYAILFSNPYIKEQATSWHLLFFIFVHPLRQ